MKLLLILLVLVISACSLQNPFQSTSTVAGEGVRLELINYPTELKQNQPFSFKIRLTNNLESEVNGRLCIFDTPGAKGVVPGEGECMDVALQPAERVEGRILPSEEEVNFPSSQGSYVYSNIDKEFKLSTVFYITFRYVIDTKHGTTVCLKNPQLREERSDCPDKESLSLIQPETPLEITNVKKEVIPQGGNTANVNVQFTIKKVQEGYLFDEQKLFEAGSSDSEKLRFNIQLGSNRFMCSPIEEGNIIELRENERVINCFTSVNIDSDVVNEQLIIQLRYGFEQKTDLPAIEVEPLGNQRLVS